MAIEEEESKGFRVRDKRRFSADGTAREEGPEEREETTPVTDDRVEAAAQGRAGAGQPPTSEPAAGPEGEQGPRIDFMTFIASLATNALAALGMLPKEQSQGLPVNPDLGREYIEILAMLQEKTRGNLTAQEADAMQRLVTDLRLQYVEVMRQRGG